jgi:prepilin-type processing-associated H-X9-DG protein
MYFDGPSKMEGGKELFSNKTGIVVGFAADDRTVVISDRKGIEEFVLRPAGKGDKLAPALATAASGKYFLQVAVSIRSIPGIEQQLKGTPPVVAPLIAADLATLTVGMEVGAPKVSLAMVYPGESEAKDAETAMKSLCLQGKMELKKGKAEMESVLYRKLKDGQTHRPLTDLPEAGAALVGLGAFAQLEDMLDNPPVTRTGNRLGAEFVIPKEMTAFAGAYSAVGIGLLLPAVQKVREAAARMSGANNLKQIALAMHNMHDTYGAFPSAAPRFSPNAPADPKKRLSWRVHLLPYMEQNQLYQQFKLDEPWDSPANKKAAEHMPKFYADPRADAPPGMTYYKVFTGKDAMFDLTDKGRKIDSITDGTSNTIMVVAGGDPVPWTKPEDIEFDPTKNLPDLGKAFGGGINVAMADGSVRFLQLAGIKPETLKAMITPAGGEIIDNNELSSGRNLPTSFVPPKPVKK